VGSHTYNSTGIYRDTFSTINCDSIYVLNLKVVTAKRDTIFETICAGQSIVLGTKNYSTAGIYRDTFVTPNCDSIRVLNLTVRNAKLDTILQSICEGHSINLGGKNYSSSGIYIDTFSTINCDSVRVLNLYILPAKRDTVNVRFCEGESVIIDSKKFTVAGFFTDTFTTVGCDSLHTIHVVTFAKPIIQISASNEVVEKGDTIQLNVSNGFSYQWTSSGILSNPLIQNPTDIISESSWVMVQTTDANNCKAFDSLFVTVKDCEGTIYVPNAFTPNGDERNDGYRIFGKCIKLNRLMIFNRWGEKVWETNNIEQEWNGYYKSVLQPTGVYVYWLSYSLGDEKVRELKGSITLIR
jgi:gliding motility-associated-like protein